MSSNRRGPPVYGDRRPSGYNGTTNLSPRNQRDRERDDRDMDPSRRDEQSNWDRDRNRDRGDRGDRGVYGRDRAERARSRSPYRKAENYRPLRPDSPPRAQDNRDSSSVVSSVTNSPAISTRALNTNNNHLPSKPTFNPHPPPGAPKVAELPTLPVNQPIPPVSLPTPPVNLSTPNSLTFNSLIAGFLAFIEESSHTSALGVDLNTAKDTYTERVSDFNKSSQLHEKFPTVKTSQSDAKDLAETKYLAIERKMEEQKAKVNSMATKAMEKLIPQVASMAASAKEHELREENRRVQQRCDSLEKSLQELVQQLTTQAKYINDIRNSNALKEAEERIEKGVKAEFTKVTDRVENVKTDLLASTNDMELLRKELDAAKASLTKAELSINDVLSLKSDLNTECQKTTKYIMEQTPKVQQNCNDLKTLQEIVKTEDLSTKQELTTLKKEIEDIKNTPQPPAQPQPSSNMSDYMSHGHRITATEMTLDGLNGRLNKVEETGQQNSSTLNAYAQKSELLEKSAQENFNAVEDRLAKLENSRHDFKGDFMDAFADDLKELGGRVDKVEESGKETRNEVPVASKVDLKALEDRLVRVEKSVPSVQALGTSPVPSSSSLPTTSIPTEYLAKFTQFENDLRSVRVEFESLKTLQETSTKAAVDSINDLVESAIDEEVAGPLNEMRNTIKSYEILLGLPAKVQTLETLNESHTTEMIELKRNFATVVHNKVLQSVREDPAIVSQTQLEQRFSALQAALNNTLTNTNSEVVSLQNSNNHLNNEILSLTNVTSNHEARINNVTTGSLASYLLDQLKETAPELQMVGALRADFDLLRQRIEDLTNDTRTLFSFTTKNDESVQKLEKDVTATKETSGIRITELIMGAEDLGKRIDGMQEQLNNSEESATDLKSELNTLKKGLSTWKDTQVHDLSSQLEVLNTEFKNLKANYPDNLQTRLDEFKIRLSALEDVEPDDFEGHLREIRDKLEEFSGIHEKVPGLEGDIATQQQHMLELNEKQEKLSILDGKITEVAKAVEKLQEDRAKITEIEGQFAGMQKQIETVENQQKAKPAYLNTAVNGVNRNSSSPNPPTSGSISAHKSRQDSVASAASDSSKSHKAIIPPVAPVSRQPSASKPSAFKPSASTPKPSTPAPTMNGAKNRSSNTTSSANDISKPRLASDLSRSRSIRSDTHKPIEKPIGSDLNQANRKRKHTQNAASFSEPKSSSTSGNARPASKRVKNTSRGFLLDDDDDEAANDFDRPKMGADDVESDDDIVITKVLYKNKPVPAVPGEDQDFKRHFS